MELDLAVIEESLRSRDYASALSDIARLRSGGLSQKDKNRSYLLDFFEGQALFRMFMGNGRSRKYLVRSIKILRNSIQQNPEFADSRILYAMAVMSIPQNNQSEVIINSLDSNYHLIRAFSLNPNLEVEFGYLKSSLESVVSQVLNVTLCARNENLAFEWEVEFEDYPWVKIVIGNILDQGGDSIVSPANSFGYMDGGLDYKLAEYLGVHVQESLQAVIKKKHGGELLVGQAEVIETGHPRFQYLISAPTMRIPEEISGTMNPYLATRAALRSILRYNEGNQFIRRVVFPGMGTGIGKVPYDISARQMRAAYEDIILKKEEFPDHIADAIQKHRVLSNNHQFRIHKGQY